MRAAYIDQYGPPDNLNIGELEVPNPGVDEVLIKVNYASINPIDYKVRRADLLFLVPPIFPRVPGCDFSGTVLRTE
jgi:NADPH:quinone reductase-like Zn-dependent oxidoreductase